MSSYTKQVLDASSLWMKCNKDTESSILNIPNDNSNNKLDLSLSEILNNSAIPSHSKIHEDPMFHPNFGRWCLAWSRYGNNVFELSDDFVAAMLLTDPVDVDISTVRLPFKGMLISIPSGFATGSEGRSYTNIHVWEMPRTDTNQIQDINKMILDTAGIKAESSSSVLVQEDAICIYATDGVHVFNSIIELSKMSWEYIDGLQDTVTEDADVEARNIIHQITFGMIAYINSIDNSITEKAHHLRNVKSKKKPKESKPESKRWEVGRTIKLGADLIRLARSGSREVKLKIQARFIVRGHYKSQAHGPRRVNRSIKWISPYWKGPEEGPRIIHKYSLDQF